MILPEIMKREDRAGGITPIRVEDIGMAGIFLYMLDKSSSGVGWDFQIAIWWGKHALFPTQRVEEHLLFDCWRSIGSEGVYEWVFAYEWSR